MNGYSRREPPSNFRETVHIGRNFLRTIDVTVTYSSTTREFQSQGGRIISDNRINGNRKITIQITATNGIHYVSITRQKGGVYHFNSGGFRMEGPYKTFF